MRRMVRCVAGLTIALISCGGPGRPAGTPNPSSATGPSCGDTSDAFAGVAYQDQDDLWLYDVRADEARRLTNDGDEHYDADPAFLGSCLAYRSTDPATIELLDLTEGGAPHTIVQDQGLIVDLDVGPDGSSLFYLQIDFDTDSAYRLKRVLVEGGAPEVLHTFAPNLGRGAGSEDEVSLAWAPDGSRLLVVNTHAHSASNERGAVYLFDASGRNVERSWTGTHPRWSPDGRRIYYREHGGLGGVSWHSFEVDSKTHRKVGMRPGTNRPSVSPDGRYIAYDTSWFGDVPFEAVRSEDLPVVYVFDLFEDRETRLRADALGPIWISDTELLLTEAKEPTGPTLNSWESTGSAIKVSLDGHVKPVAITSTLGRTAVLLDR